MGKVRFNPACRWRNYQADRVLFLVLFDNFGSSIVFEIGLYIVLIGFHILHFCLQVCLIVESFFCMMIQILIFLFFVAYYVDFVLVLKVMYPVSQSKNKQSQKHGQFVTEGESPGHKRRVGRRTRIAPTVTQPHHHFFFFGNTREFCLPTACPTHWLP